MVAIRMAQAADAEGILQIYAPHVQNSSCTFEYEVPSVETVEERIRKTTLLRPWVVCLIDDQVAGYAYASGHREREAYQWCCESSVYVKNDFQGAGIGRELYQLLFRLLKEQGYRNVYAGITLPNEASQKLHERCGFVHFAVYDNVGYKLGGWKSVGWWKLQLNAYNLKPSPPFKLSEMHLSRFEKLFSTASHHISKKLTY